MGYHRRQIVAPAALYMSCESIVPASRSLRCLTHTRSREGSLIGRWQSPSRPGREGPGLAGRAAPPWRSPAPVASGARAAESHSWLGGKGDQSMPQQIPRRYYIVKGDDQPVVRAIPVRLRAVPAATTAPTSSIDERTMHLASMPATPGTRQHRHGPARVAHLVRNAVRRRGASR